MSGSKYFNLGKLPDTWGLGAPEKELSLRDIFLGEAAV